MGIILETSSAYNPQSNGLSESGVKRCKQMIIKSHLKSQADIDDAVYHYNCKERTNGQGRPLELFLKRKTKFILPTINKTELATLDLRAKRQRQHELMRLRTQKRRDLPQYQLGDHVILRDQRLGTWKEKGTIVDVRTHQDQKSWSYWVHNSRSGGTKLRNSKDLRIDYEQVENSYLAGVPQAVQE